MIKRRQRFVASIAAVAAMVVVVLFTFGEILSAQEQRVTLILCSHPGASRDFDGSLLNGDSTTGDLIATHPTVGNYRESVNEGGAHSNLAWATYNYWSPLIEVSDEDIDQLVANQSLNDNTTVPCVLRAQFRINNRIAIAQYGPCVPVDRDGDGRVDFDANNWPLVSIRVWLNNTKVAEHETIPCEPGSDYELPGQTEPVPFRRPPGLSTPQPPVNPGGGGGGGGDGVRGGGVPGEDDSDNGDTSGEDDSDNGDTSGEDDSGEDDSDIGDTPDEGDSDNGDSSDDGDSDNGSDSNGQEDSTEDGGTPDVGAGGTAADEDSSAADSEDQQQQGDADEQGRDQEDSEESTSSQASADTEDTLESEDDTRSNDILEAEEDTDTEAQDLMEQEGQAAEETDTRIAQVDEDNAETGESGRPGPRVPGTGSGGAVDSKRELSWPVVLGASLGTSAAIALLLLLGFNRRSSRRTG